MARLIRAIVGPAQPWPTGQEKIETLRDAIKWRLGNLPLLDASVCEDGSVMLFVQNTGRRVL